MTSKRWTIICLTLTLLIFGCSDSQMAKVKRPAQPDKLSAAATWSNGTTFASQPTSASTSEVDADEPLGISSQFQPPESDQPTEHPAPNAGADMHDINAAHPSAIPLGIPQVDSRRGLPPLPGLHALPDVPSSFPGLGNGRSPIDPNGMLGPGRNGTHPGLPPELPGFELPGFEGGVISEQLRLPQSRAIPATNKENNEARSSTSG